MSDATIIMDNTPQTVTVDVVSSVGIENDSVSVITADALNPVVLDDSAVQVVAARDISLAMVEELGVCLVTVGEQGPAGPAGPTGNAVTTLSLEAGETLEVGDPAYVSANKFYKADNTTTNGAVGVVTTRANLGGLATATLSGLVTLEGLSPGAAYFLSAGVISATAPISGYIIRMGVALGSNLLLLNIEEPVLLS